ncbi:hypothetical protein N9B73_11265 [Verrucomicrobiales bacterium]|nr:hypothetical protein [Verrucomicrobiales bacterium]
MNLTSFKVSLLVLTSLFLQTSCSKESEPNIVESKPEETKPTPSLTNFTVDFPTTRAFMPASWINEPISAEIEPLDDSLKEEAKTIILNALRKYPPSIQQQFLSGVSLVGALRFYDVSYGGTYMANGKRIILVYRKNFNKVGFEQRFHHEFSSILLKKNKDLFESSRWETGNAPGFEYRAKGVIEEQTGDRSEATRVLAEEQKKTGGSGSGLLDLNTDLMEQGFLTLYNRVSIEQDLNETAAHLFTNPSLWTYAAAYPRIDHKVDVLIDFYRTLDPTFDRLYFRTLNKRPEPATTTSEPAE